MSRVLAIGNYKEADARALRDDFDPVKILTPADIATLEDTVRNGIEGVALMGHRPCGVEEMALLPKLRALSIYGVGFDAVDIAAVRARDYCDQYSRRAQRRCGRHRDRAVDFRGAQLRRRRASGAQCRLGRIGREIANRLTGFRSDIHYLARSPKATPGWTFHADILSLAHAVDDLFIATAGGAETRGMVGADVLAALGLGYVINIARGTIIYGAALIAALDVFQGEPSVDPRLARHPKVCPLPHIASATVEARARMGALQRNNLRLWRVIAPDPGDMTRSLCAIGAAGSADHRAYGADPVVVPCDCGARRQEHHRMQ